MPKTVTLSPRVIAALETAAAGHRSVVIADKDGTPLFTLRRVGQVTTEKEDFWLAPPSHRGWKRLRTFVSEALPTTTVPRKSGWQRQDNEGLWMQVVGQVVVVGGSRPAEKIGAAWETLGIGYSDLVGLSDAKARRMIHKQFRRFGVRWVGDKPGKKSESCVRNLRVLEEAGGPRAFFKQVAAIRGDTERIDFVMRSLSHMGAKSARDLLMNTGLLRNSIALDTRVVGALRDAGVVRGDAVARYDEVEQAVIDNVAVPLGVEPVVVDRAIYQARG